MKKIATLEELELELFLRRRENGEIIWKTQKGDEIPINRMSDSHLANTINMIHRNEEERAKNIEALEALASIGYEDIF